MLDGRIMGLDVGDKTIGVAVSDLMGLTAQGVKTIKRVGKKKDIEAIKQIIAEKQVNKSIKYHVACLSDKKEEFEYNNARCFKVAVPNIGPAKAVYYDIAALKQVYSYVIENNIEDAIVYILACRIGPFLKKYVKLFHEKNIKVFVNPDGNEFKRSKWNWVIKQYWKLSERLMIKNVDYVICDSQNIEKYILESYKKYNPQTTFISYGADIVENNAEDKFTTWAKEYNVEKNEYYLIVGRFVPENNFETIIREFMNSNTKKRFSNCNWISKQQIISKIR